MISVFGSKVGLEELKEVGSSMDNQWLGMGPKVKEFEENLSKRVGQEFVLLDSGSNALYMALKLLDLKPGSEVILPSFTWISCATSIVLAGLKPVFCDVDIETSNITAELVYRQVTDKTRAVMVVHYAGLPADVDSVKSLGFDVIEDAAHAIDSKIDERYCGTIADIGVYSFDGVKNLAMGEGGGITGNGYMERAKKLRYCGIGKSGFESSANKNRWWEYEVSEFFIKMLPSDISASIGLAQLRRLDALQGRRQWIWDIYQSEFKDISWFDIPSNPSAEQQHSYFTYLIRLKNNRRDELAKYLYNKGIYTTLRYAPLHLIPIYGSDVRLPNTELLNEIGLNIPLHPNLTDSNVEYIIDCIKNFV